MSRNGSGVYSLAAGNPVVTGTTISSTTYNNTLTDIASALTGSVAADGQTPMTGNLAMGSNKITGLANASARTDVPAVGQVQDGSFIYVGTVGGTGDIITLSPSPAITSYTAGQTFRFIASAANTTNVTVNISALGAKAVDKNGTTALVANDILSGALITITYDGTQFQMVPSTNLLATDSAVIHNTLTSTTGDMIYASSANTPARLAVGAAGSVLIGGTTPSYSTAINVGTGIQIGSPTGGDKGAGTLNTAKPIYYNGISLIMPLFDSGAISASAGVEVTSVIDNTKYLEYIIKFYNLVPAAATQLALQVSSANGAPYDSNARYLQSYHDASTAGTGSNGGTEAGTLMGFGGTTNVTAAAPGLTGEAKLIVPPGAGTGMQCLYDVTYTDGTHLHRIAGMNDYNFAVAVNAFKVFFNGQNISSGRFVVWGIPF